MTEPQHSIAPGKRVWKRFRQNRLARLSLWFLLGLAVLGLLAPVLSTSTPWYIKINGASYFPAFSGTVPVGIPTGLNPNWKQLKAESLWQAPIPYDAGGSDRDNGYLNARWKGPADQQWSKTDSGQEPISWRERHFLGTTQDGSDVLAGLIHGARLSLGVGFGAMLLAGTLGLLLGAFSGYFGDHRLRVPRLAFWSAIPGIILAYFYGFQVRSFALADSLATSFPQFLGALAVSLLIFVLVLAAVVGVAILLARIFGASKTTGIPLDTLVMRMIEVFDAVPKLILIIAFAALVAKPSIWYLVLILGFTSWTGIARLTRAEFLKLRELDFIQAARAAGLPELRIILRHALPNVLPAILITLVLGVGSAILAESALSFLGIGVPRSTVTWGSLLNAGKDHVQAWWLVLFPGLAIFGTVLAINLVGEAWQDALNPVKDHSPSAESDQE